MKERGFLRDLFYYMNPKNLSSDIKGYGYSLSVKRTLLLFIAEIIGAVGVGYLFGLTPFFTTIVAVFGILCFPILLKNSYKGRYEQQRFSDITEYMEQMLYSFRANHSVLTSLDESSRSFDEGPMKRTILEAINKINTSQGVHSTQQGLAHIESFYKNNRLRTIHKFMLRVEQIGGCFDSTIDVLLKDREMWVERQNLLQKEKKRKFTQVLVAVAVTLFICLTISMYVDKSLSGVEIRPNLFYQIVTTIVLIADIIICVIAHTQISADYLTTKSDYTVEKIRKDRDFIKNYNKANEIKKSMPIIVLPAVLGIVGYMTSNIAMYVLAAIFIIYFFAHPDFKFKSATKRLRMEAQAKFPRWLMEIALQLQTTSVNTAIFNTTAIAPEVLKEDLGIFKDEISKNPGKIEPYLNFMKFAGIPEIQSTMRLLHSLAEGTGGDFEVQIKEILSRNIKMLDKAERIEDENKIASLMALQMSTELTGGLKLVVDMCLFLFAFLSYSSKL